MTLNFILVNGPEGWLIADVESPHDSLRMFLEQFRGTRFATFSLSSPAKAGDPVF